MIGLILWLLISLIGGFFIISHQGCKSLLQDKYLVFSLSFAAGFGFSSLVLFIWLIINNGCLSFYPLFEAGILVLLSILFLKNRLSTDNNASNKKEMHQEKIYDRPLNRVSILFLFLCFLALFFLGSRLPHGLWDSWSIWNLKARFIFRGGESWAGVFSSKISFSHPDYPLFLPLTIVRGWLYCLNENFYVQISTAVFSSFAVICALFGGIRSNQGTYSALIAVFIVFSTPFFIQKAISQYADVLISLLFLCSLILVHRCLANPETNLLKLTGFITSLSAWVKNEGLLFFCVVAFILTIECYFRRRSIHETGKFLRTFLFGALPSIVVIAVFKLGYVPANDLFEKGPNLTESLNFARIWLIACAMVKNLFFFGEWTEIACGLFNPPVLMLAYFLLRGFPDNARPGKICNMIFLLMLLGYFAVFVITPHDTKWHLNTACSRLYLQFWPGFVFSFFVTFNKTQGENDCSQVG